MPIFVGGSYIQVVIGGALVLGDIGVLPRLPMVTGVEAQDTTLGPIVGAYAEIVPADIPLTATRTVVASPTGYTVTLAVPNNFGPLYYTLDGTTVDRTKTRYVRPIAITGTPGQAKTLKYKAFAIAQSGFVDSVEYSVTLTIPQQINLDIAVNNTANPLVKDIVITPIPVGDMTIRYTIDGAAPTSTTGTVYAGTFQVTGTAGSTKTIRAIAFPNQVLGENYHLLQSDLEIVTVTF